MREQQPRKTPFFSPYSSSASSLGYCNICCNRYDEEDCKPLLICQNDHCICRACLRMIRRKARCPFCRGVINIHRIRLNKEVMKYISKQKKGAPERKTFITIVQNDRLITQGTVNEAAGQVLIDPAELIEQNDAVNYQDEVDRSDSWLNLLLFIELFLLQLPFGLYSLITQLLTQENICLDHPLNSTDYTLRSIFLTLGYLQFLIGTLAVFFSVMHFHILLNREGVYCYSIFLLLMTIMKNIFSEAAYYQILREDYFKLCDKGIANFAIISMIINYLEMALGLFLMVKCAYRLYLQL